MNKKLPYEVKKALAKLTELNADHDYIVHCKKVNAQEKTVNAYKKELKEVLDFKLTPHGLLVPSDAIEREWRKQNLTVSDSVIGNTKGYKVHHYFGSGEGISFDVHKSKPRKAVVVYRNLQWEDYR